MASGSVTMCTESPWGCHSPSVSDSRRAWIKFFAVSGSRMLKSAKMLDVAISYTSSVCISMLIILYGLTADKMGREKVAGGFFAALSLNKCL